jgi:two-component system cell cycle sensor histidine kinase/response regulator CckA
MKKPTYEELEARVRELEGTLEALRRGEADLLLGAEGPYVLRAYEAQKALEESEERFRSISHLVTDYIYSFSVEEDGSLKGEWVSESFVKVFGLTKEEIDERGGWQSMVYPEDLPAMIEHVRRVASGEKDIIETRFVTRSGQIRWIRDHAIPVWDERTKRVFRIYGAARDITDEKLALEALERSRREMETVISTTPALIVMVDSRGRILLINRALQELTGFRREDLLGKPVLETLVSPEWREEVRARWSDPRSPSFKEPFTFPLVTAQGAQRLIEWRCAAVPAPEGEGQIILATGLDITERVLLEQELRDRSNLLEHVLTTSPTVVYIVRPSERGNELVWVSGNVEEITGYSVNEAMEPGWWERNLHPEDRERMLDGARRFWRVGKRLFTSRYRFLKKDGNYMWVRDDIRVLKDERGEPVEAVGAWTDITLAMKAEEEARKLQEQLLQSQKMEAVGRLAGGVAHDFNNMLTVIRGYAEVALQRLRPEDPLYEDLQEIMAAADRSSELTRQLLAFSRKQTIAPRPLDLNEHIEQARKLLGRLLGEDITLELALEGGLWQVFMDPAQVDQILANLLVNSRDAMPKGGSVIVETMNVLLDETYCKVHPGSIPGDYVLLAVTDTGCGMTKETLEKAFEPFFTTKAEGKGTGLGLSTVYGIVKQNQGLIYLYSEPGAGTTVKIYIPRYAGGGEMEEEVGRPKSLPVGERETILLVEDEASLRKLAARMLKDLGYQVLEASSPKEALELCESYKGNVDLLFTDVVMPLMNGRELSERIREMRPGVRTLFMSGYTSNAIAHHGVLEPGMEFIQKPFSMRELALRVKEALAKK